MIEGLKVSVIISNACRLLSFLIIERLKSHLQEFENKLISLLVLVNKY